MFSEPHRATEHPLAHEKRFGTPKLRTQIDLEISRLIRLHEQRITKRNSVVYCRSQCKLDTFATSHTFGISWPLLAPGNLLHHLSLSAWKPDHHRSKDNKNQKYVDCGDHPDAQPGALTQLKRTMTYHDHHRLYTSYHHIGWILDCKGRSQCKKGTSSSSSSECGKSSGDTKPVPHGTGWHQTGNMWQHVATTIISARFSIFVASVKHRSFPAIWPRSKIFSSNRSIESKAIHEFILYGLRRSHAKQIHMKNTYPQSLYIYNICSVGILYL